MVIFSPAHEETEFIIYIWVETNFKVVFVLDIGHCDLCGGKKKTRQTHKESSVREKVCRGCFRQNGRPVRSGHWLGWGTSSEKKYINLEKKCSGVY